MLFSNLNEICNCAVEVWSTFSYLPCVKEYKNGDKTIPESLWKMISSSLLRTYICTRANNKINICNMYCFHTGS